MSIIAVLTIPTEFGLPQLLTREVAAAQAKGDFGRIRTLIGWGRGVVFSTSAIVAGIALTCLWMSGEAVSSPLGMTMVAGLVMVPLVALSNLQSASLRGLQHIVKGQIPDTFARPVLYSAFLWFATWLSSLNAPYVAMCLGVAAAAISCLLAAWLLGRALPRGESPTSTSVDTGLWLRSALPMALTEGMRVLQSHTAVLLLGLISTAAMVGHYRVAASVSIFIALVVTIFNIVAAPVISKLYAQSELKQIQKLLKGVVLGMTGGTLVLALPFVLGGRWFVTRAFGGAFADSTAPLTVLCAGAIVASLWGTPAIVLNMTGNERRVTRAATFSMVVLLFVGFPMVYVAEATGAALASVCSTMVWQMLMWRDCRRFVGVDPSMLAWFAPCEHRQVGVSMEEGMRLKEATVPSRPRVGDSMER